MKLQIIFGMKIETTNITNNMQNWHRKCCIHAIEFFSQMKLYIILRMKSETTNITIIIYKVTAKCPYMLSKNKTVRLSSWVSVTFRRWCCRQMFRNRVFVICHYLLSQPNPNLNHNLNPNTTKKLGETR